MEDFSLYVLDITMNSVRAGAGEIAVTLEKKDGMLTFTVADNGCGMTDEMQKKLADPFFTTRTTRKVGLGVPFLKMLANNTDGDLTIESRCEAEYPEDHGTVIRATFRYGHIDFIPMGDITETFVSLIQGYPHVDFVFTAANDDKSFSLSCAALREMLGEGISLADYEILCWIRDYLKEGISEII